MKEQLLQLLKALEVAVPPASGTHHCIYFCQYGSDEEGWQDKLTIHILGRNYFFDDGDLDLPNLELVAMIAHTVRNTDQGEHFSGKVK